MSRMWDYTQGEQKFGPVSSKQLKALADTGELRPHDRVRPDGTGKWREARHVKGLFTERQLQDQSNAGST